MLRFILSACLLGFTVTASATPVAWNVDTNASKIHWVGSKVIGSHHGTVLLKDGHVAVDGNKITGGKFTIDFATINDEDLTDAKKKGDLEGHLKSADFFDVAAHPTGTFEFLSATPLKQAHEYEVTGKLTVKANTREIKFPAMITFAGGTATAKADLKINRTEFGIKYNSAKFFDIKKLGDKAINDDIAIKLDLVAKAPGKTTPVAGTEVKKSTKAKK